MEIGSPVAACRQSLESELSSRSGLPPATIKYYLRAGLLPAGATQGSTWATYDESHLRRLRLVRALTDVAGLSLEEVRRALEAVAASGSEHQARGVLQWSFTPEVGHDPSAASLGRVDALLARHDWQIDPQGPHRRTLAAALDTLDDQEVPASEEALDAYVQAMESVAVVEVGELATEVGSSGAAERLVVGTLLNEPVLLALRRMAHEVVSARP